MHRRTADENSKIDEPIVTASCEDIRQEVVDANRILVGENILDAYGHVSARSPSRVDRFLISRSMAPALVTPQDILELDLDGTPVSEPGARVFLERFIHGEIYRRRPDVRAIVHSHSLAVLPFTVVRSVTMRPICHMCGFLARIPATLTSRIMPAMRVTC